MNVYVFLDTSIQYNHMYVVKQFISHICISCVYISTPVCLGRKYTIYMKVLHKLPPYVFYVDTYYTSIYIHVY